MTPKYNVFETVTHLQFSFVIPTLNEEVMLARLLISIAKLNQTVRNCVCETIIVDAGSTDGTTAIAETFGCEVIRTKPGSVAASRNHGAAIANGNTLAFVDADCELPVTWLQSVAREFQNHGTVAAGSIMAANKKNPTWVESAWFELAHRQHTQANSSVVEWLPTFNLAVNRSAFESAGGFDESLSTCEDVEFGYRLSDIGELRRINDCGVQHYGESQSIKDFYTREAWRAQGARGLVAKHWRTPREVISFCLPFVVIGSLSISLAMVIYALITTKSGQFTVDLAILFPIAIGPIIVSYLVLRRRVKRSMFGKCAVLICVYSCARLMGTLRSFQRLDRVNS